jgi:hypothetical protein
MRAWNPLPINGLLLSIAARLCYFYWNWGSFGGIGQWWQENFTPLPPLAGCEDFILGRIDFEDTRGAAEEPHLATMVTCLQWAKKATPDSLLDIMMVDWWTGHASLALLWPWDGHYKSILLPADEEIMGSLWCQLKVCAIGLPEVSAHPRCYGASMGFRKKGLLCGSCVIHMKLQMCIGG